MNDTWILIEHGTVIDGTGAPTKPDCPVLIRGNRIHSLGAEAHRDSVPREGSLRVIDATGKSVMPGMIDAHVHLTYGESRTEEEIDLYTSHEMRTLIAARNVTKVLRAGVTGISQPGGSYYIGVGIRDGLRRGMLQGPRMTSAGRYLTTSNGLTDWYPDSVGVPAGNIGTLTNTMDQMRNEVRHQVKNGVDLIKLADSPYGNYQAFGDDELKVVSELAHRLGKKVTIHARGSAEVGAAVDAGFDWIMHGNVMTDAVIDKLAESQIPLVPTLLLLANMADFADVAQVPVEASDGCKRMLEKTADTLHRAHAAGVKFAMGTDSGFSIAPFGEWHGRELDLLRIYAGLSPLEAIKAGTSNGSGMLNLQGEVGEIAAGMLGDVIVVDGDPSIDLRVLQNPDNILHVILDGVVQEFDSDLREQRFHHDRLPNEFSYKTLTHDLLESSHVKDPVHVPWSAEEKEDLVADERRLEGRAAEEASGRVMDGSDD